MATWSITGKEPSTAPEASINSSTGAATFPANTSTTEDNVYTITYDAGNGCTQSTRYTIPKCVPSCTYTVKSDVTGATVHWYVNYTVGDTVIYIDYGYGTTDSNGTASISASESNKMRASLSKTDITFDDNNGKEINCNGEITINKYTPVCNTVQYVTAGYPDGCTFSCNGQTSTSSNDSFTIPSDSAGATITVSCPNDKVAITSSFYVRCGEYCTFEIYKIVPINVYGEVSAGGWATFYVEGAEEEMPTVDVEFIAEYTCDGIEVEKYDGAATVNDGEWSEYLTAQCSSWTPSWFQTLVIKKATFPETGTNERFDSGSYTCFRIS